MKASPIVNRSFFGAALGTLIEYYDYAVLVIFLPLISPLFFPAATTFDSLVKGFYAMLVAMIARPLGGLFFGYFGDRFGRRRALLSSMYGIAIATIIMGLTPSHEMIGVWAALLLTFTKAVQLFCFGGEYNGAGIYVVEHANNRNEAFVGSLLTATMLVGSLIATLIGFLTQLDFMPDYAWRLAFVFGGLMGILGIIFRKNLAESPNFKQADPKVHDLKSLLKNYPKQLWAGVCIGGFATLPFTTVVSFINPVLMTKGFLSKQALMLTQSALLLVAIAALIIAGRVADKKSPQTVMQCGAFLLMLFSFPLLWLIDSANFVWILLAEVFLLIINEMLLGPSNACLKNLFPMQYRYRASSLSFTLGMATVGGLTPVVESYLYKETGSFASLSIWLIFIATLTLFSIRSTKSAAVSESPTLASEA